MLLYYNIISELSSDVVNCNQPVKNLSHTLERKYKGVISFMSVLMIKRVLTSFHKFRRNKSRQ